MSQEQSQGFMDTDFDLNKEAWARELLECPVCFEIPRPPIRLCITGHIVCNNCREQTHGLCPLCRNPYSETRNLVAEGIVARCKFSCKNAGICTFIGKLVELEEHSSICDYRPVECCGCNKRPVEYSEYKKHLIKHHRLKVLECDPNGEARGVYNIDINRVETCIWPQYYIEAFDQIFLIRLHYLSDSSVGFSPSLSLWVSLFGPQSESNKFTATIEMRPCASGSLETGSVQSKWIRECRVNNFRDEAIQVIKGVGALSIHVGEILLKCGANFAAGEWSFRIVVHKTCLQSSQDQRIPATLSPISFPSVPSLVTKFGLPSTLISLSSSKD